jgi:hypothetical protein
MDGVGSYTGDREEETGNRRLAWRACGTGDTGSVTYGDEEKRAAFAAHEAIMAAQRPLPAMLATTRRERRFGGKCWRGAAWLPRDITAARLQTAGGQRRDGGAARRLGP